MEVKVADIVKKRAVDKAFRTAAALVHPDKEPDSKKKQACAEAFKELSRAKDILIGLYDPRKELANSMEGLNSFQGSGWYVHLKQELDQAFHDVGELRESNRTAREDMRMLKEMAEKAQPQFAQKFFQDNAEILKITDFERHLLKQFFGLSAKTGDTFKKQEIEEVFLKTALRNLRRRVNFLVSEAHC